MPCFTFYFFDHSDGFVLTPFLDHSDGFVLAMQNRIPNIIGNVEEVLLHEILTCLYKIAY